MALRLINDRETEGERLDARDIADGALAAYRDVPNVESQRKRLEAFVSDIIDGDAPHAS